MSFDFAAAIAARPSAAQVADFYGRFRYRESPTQRGAVIVDAAWENANITRVDLSDLKDWPLYQGVTPVKSVRLHTKVAPIFRATMEEAQAAGVLADLYSYDGAFMARHMVWNPRNPLSFHSWGVAFDVDVRGNGYGIPHSRMDISRRFVRFMEERGWSWGGRWSPSDGMHFEWVDQHPALAPAWQDAKAAAPKLSPMSRVRADVAGLPGAKRLFINGAFVAPIARVTVSEGAKKVMVRTGEPEAYAKGAATQDAFSLTAGARFQLNGGDLLDVKAVTLVGDKLYVNS